MWEEGDVGPALRRISEDGAGVLIERFRGEWAAGGQGRWWV